MVAASLEIVTTSVVVVPPSTSNLPNEPVEVDEPLTVPLLSIVKVCGEVTRSDANEPVDNAEPLNIVPEPLNTLCATNPPLMLAFSSVVVLVLNEELASVIEPLIIVLDVPPNVEFHTPVVTVPTEAIPVADVILFCAAVPIVPYNVVPFKILTSALPNEPVSVLIAEPVKFPLAVM